MQVITRARAMKTKKPIQVYFEQDAVFAIDQAAAKLKIPVAEYIRNTVLKDLNMGPKSKIEKPCTHKFKTFDLGGGLTNEEMDKLIYGI
jgi:hypothetical protein